MGEDSIIEFSEYKCVYSGGHDDKYKYYVPPSLYRTEQGEELVGVIKVNSTEDVFSIIGIKDTQTYIIGKLTRLQKKVESKKYSTEYAELNTEVCYVDLSMIPLDSDYLVEISELTSKVFRKDGVNIVTSMSRVFRFLDVIEDESNKAIVKKSVTKQKEKGIKCVNKWKIFGVIMIWVIAIILLFLIQK